MTSPHDTGTGPAGPDSRPEPGAADGDHGPRVTRDEVRDLARLRRSRADRKVAGVAAGVARHLDIDPLLVRIAFVILTFFGGGGLILYAAAWVVVPEEDTGDTVIHVDEGIRTAVLVIAGALSLAAMVGDSVGGMDVPWPALAAALVLLLVLGGKKAVGAGRTPHPGPHPASASSTYPGYRPGPPPPPRPVDPRRRGPLLFPFTLALAALSLGAVGTLDLAGVDVALSAYPATVLGVVGLMLLVGAFHGRAGGLILIGLVAAAATAVTSVTNGLDMGEIRQSPDTAAELAPAYDLDVGDIVIDLTDLDATELAALPESLRVTMGIGHIRIVVPDEGLRVEAEASVDLGEVIVFGDKSDTTEQGTHGDGEHILKIDSDIVVGQIEILTEREAA